MTAALDKLERQIEQARDQDRVITPERSVIVLDKVGKVRDSRARLVARDGDARDLRRAQLAVDRSRCGRGGRDIGGQRNGEN